MNIAIYSRKSKFTGKGESIQNQIEMCKDYCNNKFQVENFLIYEDEGFSGGNTDRPQFQLMLKDAKLKKFQAVICYRLDRISRNVSDFSGTLDTLNSYNISFISITEQFDTSTPMGRAMTYIASVFAQLERETIAERVRDNLNQLAKTGRWLGGTTPLGFVSEQITSLDAEGKQRKQHKLSPNQDELQIVQTIYDKFIEFNSLTKLETYCIQNDFKTRSGVDFSRWGLRFILTNPVYAIADLPLYNYLNDNEYDIYSPESDFDGTHGIIGYNKTNQTKKASVKPRDSSEWIIAIGAHEGIISSEKWIEVQQLLIQNTSKSFRKVRNSECLLSGLIRCSNCNSFMRPKMVSKSNSLPKYYYICELKYKSKKQKCDIKNINASDLDKLVIEEIKKLSSTNSDLYKKVSTDRLNLETSQNSIDVEIAALESKIRNNEQSISNLVKTLTQAENTGASKYIIEQINEFDKETSNLKNKLLELREKSDKYHLKNNNLDITTDMITSFASVIDSVDILEKRNMLKSLIENITWDGKLIDIKVIGSNSKKN